MTVTIVIYDYSLIGGAEKVGLNLANALSDIYQVNVVSVFAKDEKPIVELNEKVSVYVLDTKVSSITKNIFKYSNKLRNIISNKNENVVISITAGLNGIVEIATMRTNAKKIYAEHSNLKNDQYGWKHKLRQKIGAKNFDHVVTLTNHDKNEFIKKFDISNEKISTIYNWVEPPKNINSLEYDEKSKRIVSLGRIVKVKGYDRAIRIAKLFFEDYPDWSWDIYGDGPEYTHIKKMIEEMGIDGKMILHGFETDLEVALKNKSIFVSTSTYEGFPISFLEARQYKLPIVSFDCPTGPKEIINDNIDGVLVEPYNEAEMVDSLKTLASDSYRRVQMSKEIEKTALRFSKEKIIKDWIELIENV